METQCRGLKTAKSMLSSMTLVMIIVSVVSTFVYLIYSSSTSMHNKGEYCSEHEGVMMKRSGGSYICISNEAIIEMPE